MYFFFSIYILTKSKYYFYKFEFISANIYLSNFLTKVTCYGFSFHYNNTAMNKYKTGILYLNKLFMWCVSNSNATHL